MPAHMRATSQNGQPPPYPNLITTISSRPGVAEGRPADRLRVHLADRRDTQVAARVPVRLHGHHHGPGPGPARLAPAVVHLMDQPAAPPGHVLRLLSRLRRGAQ